jgi:CDP-glucose 4,6-dehydratase
MHCLLSTSRTGNVIGGGDWAADRLVPDALRAFERGEPVVIRNPNATRPWQHVLEPLSGYLALAERLYTEGQTWAEGWNFGPLDEDAQPVRWIVERLVNDWGRGASWRLDGGEHPHEAHYLKLDISKARQRLGWQPRWSLAKALEQIIGWHRAYLQRADMRDATLRQIAAFSLTPQI